MKVKDSQNRSFFQGRALRANFFELSFLISFCLPPPGGGVKLNFSTFVGLKKLKTKGIYLCQYNHIKGLGVSPPLM